MLSTQPLTHRSQLDEPVRHCAEDPVDGRLGVEQDTRIGP